ncbi:LysE/ArgO family amino acid transporter [Stackebrandtia soli]|uniref:LysE/ArgO family amino acid transporter n=1 Tax=Stackebrandtia soli TaxID=1892856 RepID=UPI0039E849E2
MISWWSALSGVGFGLSLIVAIGAQNAFVLRQGIRREHVLPVVAICALSDAALIAAGVGGIGVIVTSAPIVLTIVRYGGAAFLFGYAVLAARRAWTGEALKENGSGTGPTLAGAVLACLALTWLNPHVYLDTVLLLGSVANTHDGRWWFAGGAMVASVTWFTALGYGARLLAPMFAKPLSWRILDGAIAVVMTSLAIALIAS